jgi:hypothetical protein
MEMGGAGGPEILGVVGRGGDGGGNGIRDAKAIVEALKQAQK